MGQGLANATGLPDKPVYLLYDMEAEGEPREKRYDDNAEEKCYDIRQDNDTKI